MNLIERLGGYEKAKIRLSGSDKSLSYYRELNTELLEHRRQHNIFEPDDICKLKIKHDYGLYKFQRAEGNRIYLEDSLDFAEFGIHKDVVDHATDAEIAAGKRL